MLELLQKYPEAGKMVKNHFLSRMLDSLNDDNLPDDFKEHVRAMGIDDDKVASMIGNAPRSLFDVFDDNDLFINTIFDYTDRVFRWSVNGEMNSQTYIFRKAAEQDAVAEAFKLLNKKLCQTGL
jgi:hypothetical protein